MILAADTIDRLAQDGAETPPGRDDSVIDMVVKIARKAPSAAALSRAIELLEFYEQEGATVSPADWPLAVNAVADWKAANPEKMNG
ncbi:hypothetical protein A3709_18900 [Halioglobus sp. HI00S01]|nr:hypothetical protein A3709_18900 [Halioglobus sp. HI00S01]